MYRIAAALLWVIMARATEERACEANSPSASKGHALLQRPQGTDSMARLKSSELHEDQDVHAKRVAILVNGVVDRFVPLPLLQRVAAPAARAGYLVDYYVRLVRVWNKRWSDTGNGEASSKVEPLSETDLVAATRAAAKFAGARIVQIEIVDDETVDDHANGTTFVGRGFSYPAPVSRNVLRKFQSIEGLWSQAQEAIEAIEANATDAKYDLVVLSRDDSVPLMDIDLASFDDMSKVYMPFCGPGTDPTTEPNDHIRVVGGDVADKVMQLYTDWLQNPSPELTQARFAEHFLKAVMETKGVAFEEVERLPYYDGVFEVSSLATTPRHCARKPCHPHQELAVPVCVEGTQRVPTPHRLLMGQLLLAETPGS